MDQLVDALQNKYNRPLPAADLLLTNAYSELMTDVTEAKDLGSGVIGGTECDHGRDGDNDAHALRRADERRWAEHRSYLLQISRWNRAQRHRTLLGRRLQGAPEFLAFLGFGEGSAE